MFKVFDIANVTASNLANADSASSSTNTTYRARQPVFAAALSEAQEAVGVEVRGVVESQAPLRQEYRPDHPQADQNGYVFLPNVNVVEEMASALIRATWKSSTPPSNWRCAR
jgi:flagellar basal-body rod protein FlgC